MMTFPWIPLVLLAAVIEDSPRQEMDLNGTWQQQAVAELNLPPASGPWTPCTVPGYLQGTNYQRTWLRRSFTLPPSMRGKRLAIRFGGVKYNSRVLVNGRKVGECFGGYEPFEVDVTGAVRWDGPNELAVACHDWTGVFSPGKVEFPLGGDWDVVRGVPRDKILSPIGGLYGMYGIWDDVTLLARPAVHIQDLFFKPSVRRGELVVEYVLANRSAADAEVEVQAAVEDAGRDVLTLPSAQVRIAAGKTARTTLRQAWARPILWSHVDPHLLHLRTTLAGRDPVQAAASPEPARPWDQLRTRFGFREFWTEGHKFFLNGSRVNLLATSWWPPHGVMTREEIRKHWEGVKRAGCVAFRTHTQPWPSLHYEVADELGLLMIVEGAVWNDDDTYRVHDPVFWQNYARHLRAMVDRDKNRPSVVMWSLENEFFGGRLNDASPAKVDLVRMGRIVKEHDPTRPIFYESDGDPGGVADVIGIHYPHEYPDYTCWPNEADWLDRPQRLDQMFLNGQKEFLWRKEKPLYVGEFLWLPSRDPSWHAVFFGDVAYLDYHRYRNLAKAESWKMQILGYRRHEVAGISPWTVIEGGPLDETNPLYRAHQYAYQPVAAYCLDYDRRFYSGEQVVRRVAVFNDRLEPGSLELSWSLVAAGKQFEGRSELKLGPGEQELLQIRLPMPEVRERTPARWSLCLRRAGREVFTDAHQYAVFPRVGLRSRAVAVGLYDPAGATRRLFEASGAKTRSVAALDRLPEDLAVLVVGAGALRDSGKQEPIIGRIAPERKALVDFAARGGRVLVLRQDAYPEGLFDVSLGKHQSTMTFPLRPDHPALRGVEAEDLKFWRGDHLVTAAEPSRPTAGASAAIVVSGSSAGIDHAPLLECPVGRGTIVHSQMLLVEKFDTEPAAARILANLLDYLAAYSGRACKTAVIGGDAAYRAQLCNLGLRFDDLRGRSDAADAGAYSLLLCRGEVPASLGRWLERGTNVLAHRLSPAGFETLRRELKLDLAMRSYQGAVSRAEGTHPLLGAIAREDLYWLGRHVGIDWADTPRAAGMADSVLMKTLEGKPAAECELKDWKLEGGLVERQQRGVVFATVGSATGEVEFPASDDYVLGLVARGTPCRGGWPVAQISIDGKPFGSIGVEDTKWHTVSVYGRVEQGRHKVSVAFVNDASDPPREDRNLHVEKLLVARDDGPGGVRFLTSPPATAAVMGARGTLVVDQVRWDTEQENGRKAARYACSLLTALGGDFSPRLGTAIECERMTPQPQMPFFRNEGGCVAMACNGWIKTPIRVAAGGRYTVELVAAGTPAAGVYPEVEIHVDGKKAAAVHVAARFWRSYPAAVELSEGLHELSLHFVNDYSTTSEDRNVMLDKAVFYPEER